MDTIFALASAQGKAGIAVVRISGPEAVSAVKSLAGSVPQVRGLRALVEPDGTVIDQALVLHFPLGQSFTGESTVELHLHGSPAIVRSILEYLGKVPGLRPAEPGEFTRWALENGRLDLAQVEGLADLIDSETDMQRRQAMRVFSGGLGNLAGGWRTKLIRAAALVEATIDFADEDVPIDVAPEVRTLLLEVCSALDAQADGARAAERIRDGFEIAIVGAPNAGKSTLLNRLAGRAAAITSPVAGTTRDIIEVRMDIDGFAVSFLDTAGLRESEDEVERLGIALARDRAASADLRIFLMDEGDELQIPFVDGDIIVASKSDIRTTEGPSVSGLTGAGVDALIDGIVDVLSSRTAAAGLAIRQRHRLAMQQASGHIAVALGVLSDGQQDIVAEELRMALRSIDMIVGRVDVEDLLDEIFASFCIGK